MARTLSEWMQKIAQVSGPRADKARVSKLAWALVLSAGALFGAGNQQKQAEAIAKMQAAMEKQTASVRKQASQPGNGGGFFVLGFNTARSIRTVNRQPATGDCNAVGAAELDAIITQASTANNVEAPLIRAIIAQESGGRPCAVSPKGAQGMMQLMPATSADLGVRNPFDATENVLAGTKYLRQMLDRYSNKVELALAAYNAGPARVDENGGVPNIPETEDYVASILEDLRRQ